MAAGQRGSVSWLLDLTAEALRADPGLEQFTGRVSDSGEGRWTSIAAIEEGVSAPLLTAALYKPLRLTRAASCSRTRCSRRSGWSSGVTSRIAPSANELGDRLRRLEAVTDAGLAQLDVDELLDELLDRVRELLAVDTAAVLLLDPSRGYLVATAARGIEEEVRQGVRIPLGTGFAGRIAAEKRAVIIDRSTTRTCSTRSCGRRASARCSGFRCSSAATCWVSCTSARYRRAGSPPTTATCSSWWPTGSPWPSRPAPPRSSGPRPRRCNAACCPPQLPDIPGFEFAARYVPGGHRRGRRRLVRRVRPAVRLALHRGRRRRRPRAAGSRRDGTAAQRAARLRARLPRTRPSCSAGSTARCATSSPTIMATVLCAIVDPSGEQLRLSTAGHPPPVVSASPDLPAAILDLPADLPIGVDAARPRHTSTMALPPGHRACACTPTA